MKTLKVITSLLFIATSYSAKKIECPKLTCIQDNAPKADHVLGTNECFQHDGNNPTKELLGQNCAWHQAQTLEFQSKVQCDFDVLSGKFAWVQESSQHLTGDKAFQTNVLTQDQSQLYKMRTSAVCRTYISLNKQLLPGRNCTSHDECVTMLCDKEDTQQCKGRSDTQTCSKHSDCDNAFYCHKDEKFPYIASCKTLKTSYAPCNEDSECQHTLYCWYADVKESPINNDPNALPEPIFKNNSQCLPMYSQEPGKTFGWYSEDKTDIKFKDYLTNGQYCNTGLAFQNDDDKKQVKAQCAKAIKITQAGKVLASPYKCDPTDNEVPCKIHYKYDKATKKEYSFDVPCFCALDGLNTGYCGNIIGTQEYQDSKYILYLQREKSRCHTLDRQNFRSWLDCSQEQNMENIQAAIDWNFNITHWPYIHNPETKKCIQTLSLLSWENIKAENAITKTIKTSVLIALATIFTIL